MTPGIWYRIQADFLHTAPGGMQLTINGIPSRDVMGPNGTGSLTNPGDGAHLPMFRSVLPVSNTI